MRRLFSILTSTLLMMTPPAMAQACTAQQAERLTLAMDEIGTWSDLNRLRQQSPRCDLDGMAESYAEVGARLLVDRRTGLAELLATRDAGLQRFVVRHIDTTLDSADLAAIAALARDRCPRGGAALCRQLRGAARAALHDLGAP